MLSIPDDGDVCALLQLNVVIVVVVDIFRVVAGVVVIFFNIDDGDYFVFQGSQYWKLTEDSVEPGYPR